MFYNKLRLSIRRMIILTIVLLFTFSTSTTSYANSTYSDRYWNNYAEIFYQIHIANEEKNSIIHKVKKGDTLWGLSKEYNINIDLIKEHNNLDGDMIRIGQRLEIPKASQSTKNTTASKDTNAEQSSTNQNENTNIEENDSIQHKVRKGDTIWAIAATHNVTMDDLITHNQLSTITLQIGQELDIPSQQEMENKRSVQIAEINSSEELSYAPYSREEYEWLARIIEAEAENQPYLGKVAVGSVVMNRVKDSWFPDTIEEVVKQRVNGVYQFTPVANGRINRITPSEDSYRAALEAINGADPTHDSLYFYNPDIATSRWIFSRPVVAVIGEHHFAH